MGTCENCGNDYDKAFEIKMGDKRHVFDCFECAINKLAPRCGHCKTPVIGHGVEGEGNIYCCVHCAERAHVSGLRDRVGDTVQRVTGYVSRH